METRMVNMSDFRDEHGKLDWDAYKKAERDNGESCTKCRALIWPPKGYPAKCQACTKLQTDKGEVTHASNVRCPACGYSWNPFESDYYELFSEGEHSVGCHDCEHEFTITTYISYSFKSPERLPEEVEDEEESDDEDAACPKCGEPAEWRDIEGHPDGGEYYCPLGCEVPATTEAGA